MLLAVHQVICVHPFLVIGSIYAGIATPTEGGAVSAAGTLLIAAAMRVRPVLWGALDNTVKTTAMFLLLIGGLFNSFVLTRMGVPQGMSDFLTSVAAPLWVIIVPITLLLVVLVYHPV